ncbi:MAG TPA: Crp/Fnr family transcriptional regulator [Candidatus Barnesiella excrementavium]|nr:Crp/Fnr family transcriptional regulator [Candidatus Barnesiella excrementavium]
MQTIREELKSLLLNNYQIGAADFEQLLSISKRVRFDKGGIIIEAEKVSDEIFLVESGLTRAYFWDAKGNEVTECFGVCGDFFASMFSYFKGEPSFLQYEAVTNMVLYTIKQSELENLCRQSLAISNLFRTICIEQLYCLERKCKIFGKDDALNRYISLIKERPQIVKEVPLKHIASYLGITQQSLSRLRASLKNV